MITFTCTQEETKYDLVCGYSTEPSGTFNQTVPLEFENNIWKSAPTNIQLYENAPLYYKYAIQDADGFLIWEYDTPRVLRKLTVSSNEYKEGYITTKDTLFKPPPESSHYDARLASHHTGTLSFRASYAL